MVSIKDLYVANDFTQFKELMKPALFVPENNTAYQVMEKFKESKQHSCFIVDEYGSVQGMITLNDILEAIVHRIPAPKDTRKERLRALIFDSYYDPYKAGPLAAAARCCS